MGIGTTDPKSKLHIDDGNLLFTRTGHNTGATCIFGDKWSTDNPVGEWGIQYIIDDTNGVGGLNFKRMAGTGREAVNYCLYIKNDGKIGVGTNSPQSELSVNGKITAKEIEVLITGWPDYVFNNDYKVRSIFEVEKYINENHRLPDLPSAQEVEEKGLDLGEMNSLLLKKMEEMTLYIIDLKKEIETLKSENKH